MTKPPTKRAQMKAAETVAEETLRHAASEEWFARRAFMRQSRSGDLVLPEQLPETQVQAIHTHALAWLHDRMLHDPDPRIGLKAAEIILNDKHKTLEIQAGLDAKHPIVEAAKPAPVDADVPREEKIRILRALARAG